MDKTIKMPACASEVLQEGKCLCGSENFRFLPVSTLENGKVFLRGRVQDSFCFVDHPQVELDLTTMEVVSFRCDCPEYRLEHGFCAHCAALVLQQEQQMESLASYPVVRSAKMPELTDLSYTFCNSAWDLYPRSQEPRIPQQRYIQVFGNNARARMIYRNAGLWGGSCFGMVATATMLHQPDDGARLEDFRAEATIPSQLRLSDHNKQLQMTLHQFVEAVHILQYSQNVNIPRNRNLMDPQCMENLARRVEAFQKGEGKPVGMSVWANPDFDGGHSVLPYRLVRNQDREDELHIYDPNHPMRMRVAYLEKDEAGTYVDWRFPMNDLEVYASENGGQLSMDPYENYKHAWDHRGSLAVDNLLSVQQGTVVMNAEGTPLARVTEKGVELLCADVQRMLVTDGAAKGAVMLSLPAGTYRFRLVDPCQQNLSVQMSGTLLSVTLNTTAREAMVCVEDGKDLAVAEITEADCRYAIEILQTLEDGVREYSLVGMTQAEGLMVMYHNGQLYAQGLTNAATVLMDEEVLSPEQILPMPMEQPQKENLLTNMGETEGKETIDA